MLLCENLVDLFHGLGRRGAQKRWRATIQEDGNWTICGLHPVAVRRPLAAGQPVLRVSSPFVLWRASTLTPALSCSSRRALHDGKTELAAFLRTPVGRARARAVHHLAAGNYRAYVVLSDFLDQEST